MRMEVMRVLAMATALSVAGCTNQAPPSANGQQPSSVASALEELDTSTEPGRKAAYERLRREYETLRARLDGASQDAKALAQDARREGLRELVGLCDGLERRLDALEDAGGEQWAKLRAQALEHSERLRVECERVLGEKR